MKANTAIPGPRPASVRSSSLRRANFDHIAPFYAALEQLAFGHVLQRARLVFIDEARRAQRVLLVGEGNGRFLAELSRENPEAEIHCVDASAAMLRPAHRRTSAARVHFHHSDILQWHAPNSAFDLIVTHFFLDCFEGTELAAIIGKISALAAPDACWLITDFQLPPRGIARLHARLWLATMYAFFRCVAALPARELAPFAPLLSEGGWVLQDHRDFRFGLISAQLWGR